MRPRAFWALATVGALYWVANTAMKPVVALVSDSMGLSPALIGLIVSGQALLPLFLAIPAGVLADRVGTRRMLVLGGAGMILSALAFLAATNPWLLFLAQTVLGISQVVVWLCVQALVTHGDGEGRQRQIENFTQAMTLGQIAGPLLGTWVLERSGSTTVFLSYLGLSAAITLASLAASTGEPAKTGAPSNGEGMMKEGISLLRVNGMQAALLTTFLMLYLMDLRNTFVPLYLKDIGMNPTRIGWVISAGSGAALAVRLVTGPLLRRFGERTALAVAAAMGIGGTFATPLLSNFWWLALASAIGGFGTGLNHPLTLSMIARSTPQHLRGLGMGLRLTANRAAQLVSPLLFGSLLQMAGTRPAFFTSGLLLSSVAAWVVSRYPSEESSSA